MCDSARGHTGKRLQRQGTRKTSRGSSRRKRAGSENSHLVIHVSGAPGSGKTTLGRKFKQKFGNRITVKDIDDLRQQFMESFYHGKSFTTFNNDAYQRYIDGFVKANKSKPVIFVGLNKMPFSSGDVLFNMHPKYKYFIDLDDETILKQKCKRALRQAAAKRELEGLIRDNAEYIGFWTDIISRDCNLAEMKKQNDTWRRDYAHQGYKLMSPEAIERAVCTKLNAHLAKM
jgi:hypothetical protein